MTTSNESPKLPIIIGLAVLLVLGFVVLGPSSSPTVDAVERAARDFVAAARSEELGPEARAAEFTPMDGGELALLKETSFDVHRETRVNADQTRACVVLAAGGGGMASKARVFMTASSQGWKVRELQVYSTTPPKPPWPKDWTTWSTVSHNRYTPVDNLCRHGSQ